MITQQFPLHKILKKITYIRREISDKDNSLDIYLDKSIL